MIVFDTAKGFAPAFVATQVSGHLAGVLAGGAAMLGNWRPLFMGFQRGGKIVATTGGALLGVAPIVRRDRRRRLAHRVLHDAVRVGRIDRRRAVDPGGRSGTRLPVAGDRLHRGRRARHHRAAPTEHQAADLGHGEPRDPASRGLRKALLAGYGAEQVTPVHWVAVFPAALLPPPSIPPVVIPSWFPIAVLPLIVLNTLRSSIPQSWLPSTVFAKTW